MVGGFAASLYKTFIIALAGERKQADRPSGQENRKTALTGEGN